MDNNLPLSVEEVMFLSQFTDKNLQKEEDIENNIWTIPYPIQRGEI